MPEGLRLPSLETRTVTLAKGAAVESLASVLGAVPAAYVRLDRGSMSRFLFVHEGKTHGAGSLEGARVSAGSAQEFFTALAAVPSAEVCLTDLPLFLCASVLFRKPPSLRISTAYLGGTFLKSLQESGKDAVLALRRPGAWSLAFCHGGEPVRLYGAAGETLPAASTIVDQIVALVRAHPDCVVDLYGDVQLQPAPDAGMPLASYATPLPPKDGEEQHASPPALRPRPAQTPAHAPALLVRLEGREVFCFPLAAEHIRIGRGGDKEISLESPSVSRDHAEIVREGNHLVLKDLGSVNGLIVRGSRVSMIRLTPGTEVGIGVYTMVYTLERPEALADAPPAPPASPTAGAGATVMMLGGELGVIEYAGQRYEMRSPFFNVGGATGAHLQLAGEVSASRRAIIIREPAGGFRLVARDAEVQVNGKRVTERFLANGDEITIGGSHVLRFHSEPAPSSSRKL